MTTQTNAAVQTAVQNTPVDTSLNGKTLGQVVNELARSDLKASYKAIDAAYDIVIRKGGLDDTQKALEGLKADIGERVYDVLKLSMEHCEGKLPIVRAYFHALCKKAEEYFLSRYVKENKEETTIAKAIPLWPAYKSSLTKGLELGMSPQENIPDTDAPRWPTAAKFRTEVQKREKDAKGGTSQAGNERNSSSQTTTTLSLVTKGWSPKLSASMAVLCEGLNRLSHEEQDTFAPEILAIGERVVAFATAKQQGAAPVSGTIVRDASGAVTGTARSDETSEEMDAETKAEMQTALDETKVESKSSKRRGARAA